MRRSKPLRVGVATLESVNRWLTLIFWHVQLLEPCGFVMFLGFVHLRCCAILELRKRIVPNEAE